MTERERARERLIELLNKKYDHFCDQCGVNKDSHYTDNLADYLLANGVIVPPCKVGDVVYDLSFGKINAYIVETMNFKYTVNGIECEEVNGIGEHGLRFDFQNIGKTIFLAKEEAEKSIGGIKKNE